MAVSFDEPGIQAITLSLISVAAVLSLVSVMLGLFSTLTGQDALPKRIRRMLRRMPASADDFRLRGVSLLLNGAAVMLLVSARVVVVFRVTVVSGVAVQISAASISGACRLGRRGS